MAMLAVLVWFLAAMQTQADLDSWPVDEDDTLLLLQTKATIMPLGNYSPIQTSRIDPSSGVWDGTDAQHGHVFSKCLSHGLGTLIRSKGAKTALDLGAGLGHYSAAVDMIGVNVSCYDGAPNTRGITAKLCDKLDLSQPNGTGLVPADFVWSLEVGEHVPKDREQSFIDNVVRLATKSVLVSWAVPGQGGHGHVNERSNKYIIAEFQKRGFKYDADSSAKLRSIATGAGCCCGWFGSTLMVFDRVANNKRGRMKTKMRSKGGWMTNGKKTTGVRGRDVNLSR